MEWQQRSGIPWVLCVASSLLCGCAQSLPAQGAGGSGAPGAAVAGTVASSRGAEFVVGTFNIRLDTSADGMNAWPHRRALVCSLLDGAEIWGLQEALPGQVRAISSAMPGIGMLARSRDPDPDRDEACPIAWRSDLWSLDPVEHGTFWLSERPDQPGSRSWDSSLPRICTFARLLPTPTAPRGRVPIYVFNVHLDHRGAEARARSAELVAQRIACRTHADPVILLGDFNDGPESAPLRTLCPGAGRACTARPGDGCMQDASLRDAWRVANAHAPERGTYTGWADATEGPRIDFILVSPSLSVERSTIDDRRPGGRWPSDHMPVTATLICTPVHAR